ncbi:MAG: hypothetical protein MR397_06150, partial [Oscillospiraceae bacterium]|nr:hypothetical protein [Oscillospiraceae bacterium]
LWGLIMGRPLSANGSMPFPQAAGYMSTIRLQMPGMQQRWIRKGGEKRDCWSDFTWLLSA